MIAEQPISLVVDAGVTLEAKVHRPPAATRGVVVSHPHPLYGGDMDNPVVVEIVSACAAEGLATLRFNFRGVGRSTGSHDNGHGEQDDVLTALDDLAGLLGHDRHVAAAGYSFGAMVTAAVAAKGAHLVGLALIAPALGRAGRRRLDGLSAVSTPVIVIAGEQDDACPPDVLADVGRDVPAAVIRVIKGADHFFRDGREALGEAVRAWARELAARQTPGGRRAS
jgi:alpha/beta superfamily hydrolase